MSNFERYLSLWVTLAIAFGVGAGMLAPRTFAVLAGWEWAGVNLVVAVLVWVMIYPMMLNVDPQSLRNVGKKPRGLLLTLVVNWLIKPFSMAALGVLFFHYLFAHQVPLEDANQYIAGLILLGVAPCTAMVFVWSHLTGGDATYTLVQVSINDLILVFAFAPLAGFLLGVTDIHVPWATLVTSVLLFIVVPLVAGLLTRYVLIAREGELGVTRWASALAPSASAGLLLTVFLLFGFQAETIVAQPFRVVLIAIPLILQSYGIFAIAYGAARLLRLPFSIAAPAAMIGASNFFELAVAVAISLFGLSSGAALATVVGVLIEVPVMLSLVAFANRSSGWFPTSAERAS